MAEEPSGFKIACELADFGAQMVAARFIRNNPEASQLEIDAAVRAWWSDRPGAPNGDAPGVIRPMDEWP